MSLTVVIVREGQRGSKATKISKISRIYWCQQSLEFSAPSTRINCNIFVVEYYGSWNFLPNFYFLKRKEKSIEAASQKSFVIENLRSEEAFHCVTNIFCFFMKWYHIFCIRKLASSQYGGFRCTNSEQVFLFLLFFFLCCCCCSSSSSSLSEESIEHQNVMF